MEHLNYSRQLVKHCAQMLEVPSIKTEHRSLISNVIDLHGASQKFLLPDGGRLYDDLQYRALDETIPLRLPYKYIAIEYHHPQNMGRGPTEPIGKINGVSQYPAENSVSAPKRVIYARERDGFIVITVAFWTSHDGVWRVLPACAVPLTGYLDRTQNVGGRPAIRAAFQDTRIPLSDYMDEVGALLCFLNILQCCNVHIERSNPKRADKKVKAALPFDSYHVLTIDVPGKASDGAATGGHRSPREHLRRGHIRRLADGRRIWVNATVVAAGRGAGVVAKDYAVQ